MARRIRSCSLWSIIIGAIGLTPERATGFACRLIFLGAMFCLARRWNSTVASGCTLFAALFLVSLGVAAYAWTGRLACALCDVSLTELSPRAFSNSMKIGPYRYDVASRR